jgi:hypothetical protein
MVFLNREEERMLKGERGAAVASAMKLLVTLGEMYEAERMVKVKSSHVSGVSYKSVGNAGLTFIEDFAEMGAKVVIETTLNPAGMDLLAWEKLGFSKDFAEKQLRITKAFERMGTRPSYTCTPYLADSRPNVGDDVAWAESSAVVFTNSVIGAKTNRESGPSALASAITGITPLYGYHLDENRRPTHLIQVRADLANELTFSILGYVVGEIVGDGVPLFEGLGNPTLVQLKALGASLATSGSVALYYAEDVTPEDRMPRVEKTSLERVQIEDSDLQEALNRISQGGKHDLICIGCPHCSLQELALAASLLSGVKIRRRLWFFTSRYVWKKAKKRGYVKAIEKAGARVVCDTCMVVSPLKELGVSGIVTNSCKAGHYVSSIHDLPVELASFDDCIRLAVR